MALLQSLTMSVSQKTVSVSVRESFTPDRFHVVKAAFQLPCSFGLVWAGDRFSNGRQWAESKRRGFWGPGLRQRWGGKLRILFFSLLVQFNIL
jgi:hypothetical protein